MQYLIGSALIIFNCGWTSEAIIDKVSDSPLSNEELQASDKISYGGFQYQNTLSGEKLLFTVSSSSENMCQLWLTELYPWRPSKLYEINDKDRYIGLYRISPSGKKIIFSIEMSNGGGGDIYLINSDGKGLKNITKTPEINEGNIIWLKDDRTAMIEIHKTWRGTDNLPKEFWLYDLKSLNKKKVYSVEYDPFNVFLALNTDKTKVLFIRRKNITKESDRSLAKMEILAEMNIEDQQIREFPSRKREEYLAMSKSPNGKFLKFDKFIQDEKGKKIGQICIIDMNGIQKDYIIGENMGYSIGWSSDSNFIYFTKTELDKTGRFSSITNVYKLRIN